MMPKDYTKITMPSDEELEFEALMADMGAGNTGPRVDRGDLVKGRIISIAGESTFIDLGGKAEGVLDTRELEDLDVTVGDEVEAIVISTGGEIRLSRTLASDARGKELLADAHEMGLPVEGRISGRNKGGFEVTVAGQEAFMPVSHLAIESIEDLDAWIGRTERFLIMEFDARGKRLVVSRANLLRREREEHAEKLWAEIRVGDSRKGRVTSVQDYGCFVDIGGVDGLVHIREMQWSRLGHPSELVAVDQEVTVTVLEIDLEKKRIGLSMKTADGDPWRRIGTEIKVGDTIDGEVTRLETYGVFVEVLPGTEGLVHISEITHLRRIRHPNEITSVGERVKVTVLEIDSVKRRIALSMKQVEGDPWENVLTDFPLATAVRGRVERVAPFGIFVEVAPGVTALLPGSETDHPQGTDLARHFKPGDLVLCTVLSVDPEQRRMSLSTRAAKDAEEAANIDQWKQSNQKSASSFGTFADLLKDVKLKD